MRPAARLIIFIATCGSGGLYSTLPLAVSITTASLVACLGIRV